MNETVFTWIGIVLCISQAGMFSGLNLAMLGISRLKLEVHAQTGNQGAARLLAFRKDTHFLLATIVWGNVGANVLLTLLSDSVLTGVSAFAFSTFLITFGGEILPQAYFSRHTLRIANALSPLLRFYQVLLFPIAKPTALLLKIWFGTEDIEYYREEHLREVIRKHGESEENDVDRVEAQGALNFLAFDDLRVSQEGERVHPESIVELPMRDGRIVFPEYEPTPEDPFLKTIQASGLRWVILCSSEGDPRLALDADEFLRAALFSKKRIAPKPFCHRPVIVRDKKTPLGSVVSQLIVHPEDKADDIIEHDLILLWDKEKRIITGADILGRLFRGVARRV